jgi:hypothetical protein
VGLEVSANHNNEINCSVGLDEALLIHSYNDRLQEKKELPVVTQKREDGALLLKAISKENFFSLHLKNAPYEKMMKTKGFDLHCSYQGMPMHPIAPEKLLATKDIPYGLKGLFGEVGFKFEEEFSFVIAPVRLGDDILLYPTMEPDAIGFSRQAHFY